MSSRRRSVLAVAVGLGVGWTVLPSLFAPGPDEVSVAVVADPDIATAHDEIARHVRELGRSVEIVTEGDPCDPDRLERLTGAASQVVLALGPDTLASCAALGAQDGELDEGGVTVVAFGPTTDAHIVDGTVLVPPGAAARSGCQWWEPFAPAGAIANCEADGSITVRDEVAALTAAGRDRVGRIIAGLLR